MGPIDPRKLLLMQGMGGSLPQAPNIGGPMPMQQSQMIQGPQMQQHNDPLTNAVDGITKFINSYRQSQDAMKNKAASEVERDMKLLSLGIPVDQKRTLKNMKKAGINIDPEGPTPEETAQYNQQYDQELQQAQQRQGFSAQVPQSAAGMPHMMPPQQVQLPAMQPPQYQPPQGSSTAQSLQQMLQMGQMEAKLREQQMSTQFLMADNAKQLQVVMKGALSGEPKALEMAYRSGIMQAMPLDQLEVAATKAGVDPSTVAMRWLQATLGTDKVKAQMMSMAEGMAKYFDNDLERSTKYVSELYETGQSSERPGMSMEERLKVLGQANELQKSYPLAPRHIVEAASLAAITGNSQAYSEIMGQLQKTPSEGRIKMWFDEAKLGDQKERTAISKAKLGIDQAQLGLQAQGLGLQAHGLKLRERALDQQLAIQQQDAGLRITSMLANAGGEQLRMFWDMYSDKDADTKQKNIALEGITSIFSQMSEIKVPVGNGKFVSLSPNKMSTREVESLITWPWETKALEPYFPTPPTTGKKPEPKQQSELSKFLANWGKESAALKVFKMLSGGDSAEKTDEANIKLMMGK
jgi:hypothetical protein